MAHKGSNGSGDLYTEILIDRKCTFGTIYIAQHGSGDRDCKDVVSIGEETDTSYQACPDVVPSSRYFL